MGWGGPDGRRALTHREARLLRELAADFVATETYQVDIEAEQAEERQLIREA